MKFTSAHEAHLLWNETGQMTVFVALIFQVLFVFFAMVINIGLLVHDKINLQNAVDFGAYYGAQRQAEILNEIAHVNYQMHQDNKLLAWRFHVLANLGRTQNQAVAGASEDVRAFPPGALENENPSVCVMNPYWFEATQGSTQLENYCYRPYGSAGNIVKIPPLIIAAPFVPGVLAGAIQIGTLIGNQTAALTSDQGPLNWTFAMQMLVAYRVSLSSRKAVIQKLRANLVSEDLKDQKNESTRAGVLQTIKKNLTLSNASSFNEENFRFANGLANPACSGQGGDGSGTISEVRTAPLLLYTYTTDLGSNFTLGTDAINTRHFTDDKIQPPQLLQFLSAYVGEPAVANGNDTEVGLQASSLGFEKNPWCMAYVGVSAKTSPRKPFAPFGKPVQLVARSFAQPFGGRVGPWYKNQWPQNASQSTGARIDPLSTPRFPDETPVGGANFQALLPNYSRYPGDQAGVRALAHQAAERRYLRGYNKTAGGSQLSFQFYVNFDRIPIHGDPLAFDNRLNASPTTINPEVRNVRNAEELAVAPDLFDATYYSIDLNYAANYKMLNNGDVRFGNLGNPFGIKRSVAPDIGGRNGTLFEGRTIKDQIENANNGATGLDPLLRNTIGYYLSKAEHVLTGWAPKSNSDFGFPVERFGICKHYASKLEYMIPGVCTNGGRVGYSVRTISRDHLLSPNWEIGGEGQKGPIKNPPPLDL